MNLLNQMAQSYESAEERSVYIMKVKFRKGEGYKVLYKIGVAKDAPKRASQVLLSFFHKRRYFPELQIMRFRKITNYFEIETKLHQLYAESQYDFKGLQFDGSSEFFDIDEDKLLELYDETIPTKKDKMYVAKLPEWAYSDEEKEQISNEAIQEDLDGYVVST
jgi:hypothetical protein